MSFVILLSISTACHTDQMAQPNIKEGYATVAGGKIWYKVFGANKPKTPLIVIHGGPGATHDYLLVLAALADERPVVFYDQLGCGNSPAPNDTSLYNVTRYASELNELIAHLGYQQVHLLGQSWGGYLATQFALNHNSTSIRSLVLSAPLLSTRLWQSDQDQWVAQLPQATQDTIAKYEALGDYSAPAYQDAMMEFYNLHLCRRDPWPESLLLTFQKMNTFIYNYMWGPSEFRATGTLKNADLTGQLNQITLPCLITCGRFDEAMPQTMMTIANTMPDAEVRVFEDAAHSHHLEQTELYLAAVRSFLTQCDH